MGERPSSKEKLQSTETPQTRAFVLHPNLKANRSRRDPDAGLEEAISLARALGALDVVGGSVVPLPRAHPGMLFGAGKIEELAAQFKADQVGLVLIDGPVTPVQQRNLEKAWQVKLLDRTGLILEIFSDRARTREGVLQVEMAALNYQRTRLVRAWTHLERQRGGLGFVGGPGETQIEADRRAIDEQMVRLRRQLDKVVKTRSLHRKSRAKVPFPIVALVGYTNAGKSTLFNRATGADVLAKDMLFATLDPTMRRLRLTGGSDVILSDTVGFISELPTELVAAFRATLEEVLDADLILHIRDIAHGQTDQQAADVAKILNDLGVDEDRIIEVWNKIDLLPDDDAATFEAMTERSKTLFTTSAMTGDGLEPLLTAIEERINASALRECLTLSHAEGHKRAWLFAQGVVRNEVETDTGWDITVHWSPSNKQKFAGI